MAAAGVQVSSIDTRGDSSSVLAGLHSRNTLELLLANGADIDQGDRIGRTALHGAASWGWNEAVQILAESGADLTIEDVNGLTPLDYSMGQRSGGFGRGGGGAVREETAQLIQSLILGN